MDLLGCSEIRPLLAASYDGEVSVEDQITVETHVVGCASCAGETRRLEAIGRTLRASAVSSGTLVDKAKGIAAIVVGRMKAEREQSIGARFDRLFEDLHLVWAALAATAATAFCGVLIAAAMNLTGPRRTDSLAAIMRAMACPGSNANPVRLNRRIQVPRVRPEAVLPTMLLSHAADEDDGGEKVFALSAVVTREGTIASLETLLTHGHSEEGVLNLLDVASAARFQPASFAGSPVAVNVVWLLAHTTVRGG